MLAEKLNEIAPFDEAAVSFMCNSGTEAVETAIKLARYHTGRTNFIGFTGAFHGRTMGAVTFTASKPNYHRGFYPLMNGVVHAPFPNPYRPVLERQHGEDYGETVVRYIELEILEHILPPDEVAGILVETIQGEGGYIVPPPGFYPALRKLCDKHKILLIADEVQCGMGRTGKWWAMEHFDVEPDIITIAKGIASGLPLGVCLARKSVMDWPRGVHGNTFGGNPLSCAAALATLDLIENEYLENAATTGQYTQDALHEIMARHPSIGDVRGIGLMIGVEFVKDRLSKVPAESLCNRVVDLAFERGLDHTLLWKKRDPHRSCPKHIEDRNRRGFTDIRRSGNTGRNGSPIVKGTLKNSPQVSTWIEVNFFMRFHDTFDSFLIL